MPIHKFEQNDVYVNRIRVNPRVQFFFYSGSIYYNNKPTQFGVLNAGGNIKHIPTGHVSLHEINIDRPADKLIYPFMPKGANHETFKTVATASFSSASYGDTIQGKYPLSASILRKRYAENAARPDVLALQNTLKYYLPQSRHYALSSSITDKSGSEMCMISIPSIFYGSRIKKGTVDLNFYVSGTLVGRLTDRRENGELVQSSGTINHNNNKVAGVVLYNEGFIILTGSWPLSNYLDDFRLDGGSTKPAWIHFGVTGSAAEAEFLPSASFDLSFSGQDYVQTVTMMAHAPKGKLNNSNNPTFIKRYQDAESKNHLAVLTSSTRYIEPTTLEIANITKSPHSHHSASFKKQTYISKIGIYDEDKNLIAIAKLAKPLRKREEDEFTFKLKLDI
jgi:hypothetical protein